MSVASGRELIDWIRACHAQLSDATEHNVSDAHANEFLLLYGMIARTTRYSMAYVTLLDAGLEAEAVPLARVALEHAITLQWVFITDGGVQRYQRSVGHDRIDHYTQLAGWSDNDELREAVSALDEPPAGRRLGKFMDMLRQLDFEHYLETRYNVLSQQVHVTHGTVASFLRPDADELVLRYAQENPYRDLTTHVAAMSAMLARWVLARLTHDEELLVELSAASDRLGMPMELTEQVKPERLRKGI